MLAEPRRPRAENCLNRPKPMYPSRSPDQPNKKRRLDTLGTHVSVGEHRKVDMKKQNMINVTLRPRDAMDLERRPGNVYRADD